MAMDVFRRISTVLLVFAFFGITIVQNAPDASAADLPMSPQMDCSHSGKPAPCKSPACMAEFGCVFMISLPAPDFHVTVALAWYPVFYASFHKDRQGLTIAPALGPPRRLA